MRPWLMKKWRFLIEIIIGLVMILFIGRTTFTHESVFSLQIHQHPLYTSQATSKPKEKKANIREPNNTNMLYSPTQREYNQDLTINVTTELLSVSESREAIQRQRISKIKEACHNLFPDTSFGNGSRQTYIHEHNMVSKQYKLIVCDIPKCGFSSWLAAMLVMEDLYTIDDYEEGRIHGDKVIATANEKVRLSGMKNKTLKEELWRKSLKVLTVRNPFSKVVSVYYDKFLPTSPGFTYVFKQISLKISAQFRKLRQNVDERKQIGDGTATFEDLVNFLLVQNVDNIEAHFTSMFSYCKPCDADYDYVIKFETLQNDIEYLKQKLNISEYHTKAVFPRRNFKTNEDLVKETFKKIPKKLAVKLYKKFKKDFDIFGYDIPEWLC